MSGEDLAFCAQDGTKLAGTLVRGGPLAALILNGSGPLDRDSNMRGQVLDVANALAGELERRGVGSLRFDKRGVGASGGEYRTMGFHRETDDARAALAVLRERFDRVVVVGHSVGATNAIRLAPQTDGVVLIAAPAQRGETVMEWQSLRIAELMRVPTRPLLWNQARIRTKAKTSKAEKWLWLREFMAYDPAPDLERITCPVLAITGAHDVQVDPADVARIGALVQGEFTGETPPGLTHLLRHDSKLGLGAYRKQLKRPVDAALVERVAAWVATRQEEKRW